MDFLDPRKQRAHNIRLMIGYTVIGISVLLATVILLFLSYGFDFGKNGQIIQNGLVFISSQPSPSNIYIDGNINGTTNKRIFLQAGQYTFKLTRSGYRSWVRDITVQGGSVEHFDYPVLFPVDLHSTPVKNYGTAPSLVLQSPSRQWLLVNSPDNFDQFDVFDLSQTTPALVTSTQTTLTIPSNILTASTGPQSWVLEQWSTDNDHILLKHVFEEDNQPASEYILVDRSNPSQSVNLTNTLGSNPTEIRFINNDYTRYYIYDQPSGSLYTASLSAPTPQLLLKYVLNFDEYGSNMLLYATTQNAPSGKAWVDLLQGTTTYQIHQFANPSGSQFLLDFTQYSGDWYVAAGNSADNKVYIYLNPQTQLQAEPSQAVAPIEILKVNNPTQLAFSANAQFIMTENGTEFGVYDAENSKAYTYSINSPLDTPQQFATWMDGDRIMYISKGKLVVFDYDSANQQTLMPALPGFLPVFGSNYHYVYSMVNIPANGTTPAEISLQATALLTPNDL